MPIYYWENKKTGEVVEVECGISDIDNFRDSLPASERDDWFRPMQAPAIFKRLIPSGFGIRQADGDWQTGKAIAKLDDSTLDMDPRSPERAEIKDEVRKMKRSLKK